MKRLLQTVAASTALLAMAGSGPTSCLKPADRSSAVDFFWPKTSRCCMITANRESGCTSLSPIPAHDPWHNTIYPEPCYGYG